MESIREAKKKERELLPCRRLALEINRVQGTDYDACASDDGFADALLRSASRKHPDISIQVVSVPLDWRYRNDKSSLTRTTQALADALLRRGLKNCSIDLVPTTKAETRKMPAPLVQKLADLLFDERAKGSRRLDYGQIYAYAPDLAEYFDYATIFCHRAIPKVTVEIASGHVLPPDGQWIAEGIFKKIQRYGGAAAVKDLTLLIDTAGVVDDSQIAAFKAAHPEETLPFSEIWILGLQGLVCLKRKSL